MSKLPSGKRFIDFSDYARPAAAFLARKALNTSIGAITFTWLFTVCGFGAAWLIYVGKYPVAAGVLLLLKSMFDAADGEIARLRNKPSYVGRYLDSVNDFFVNAAVLYAVSVATDKSVFIFLVTLLLVELQGSIYNYYYLIQRYAVNGDKTSRVDETKMPEPYPWDNPMALKILHRAYVYIYSWQDRVIRSLDSEAVNCGGFPNKFLTLVSTMGLGAQLLIISIFLVIDAAYLIFPFFIVPYTLLAVGIILIRRKYY